MSSPIAFCEFSEDDYRKFLRTLSDEELIKAGKRLRSLCGDVVLTTPTPCCSFPAARHRDSRTARTPGVMGITRRTEAVLPRVISNTPLRPFTQGSSVPCGLRGVFDAHQ